MLAIGLNIDPKALEVIRAAVAESTAGAAVATEAGGAASAFVSNSFKGLARNFVTRMGLPLALVGGFLLERHQAQVQQSALQSYDQKMQLAIEILFSGKKAIELSEEELGRLERDVLSVVAQTPFWVRADAEIKFLTWKIEYITKLKIGDADVFENPPKILPPQYSPEDDPTNPLDFALLEIESTELAEGTLRASSSQEAVPAASDVSAAKKVDGAKSEGDHFADRLMELVSGADDVLLEAKKENEVGLDDVGTPKVIGVANRLPVMVTQSGEVLPGPGGLAGAAGSIQDIAWVGHPGKPIADIEADQLAAFERAGIHPADIDGDIFQVFYNEAAQAWWLALHGQPVHVDSDRLEGDGQTEYRKANQIYADKILALHRQHPESPIFINDFHLFEAVRLVREAAPEARIIFFLHVPFLKETPSLLPASVARSGVEAMLAADVVGFHSKEYVENFLDYIQMLGYTIESRSEGQVVVKHPSSEHKTTIKVAPIGIAYKKHAALANNPIVQETAEQLERLFEAHGIEHVFASVGRLDPPKGYDKGLDGFAQFLRANPDKVGKVIYLVIAQPSRKGTTTFADYSRLMREKVNALNKEFRVEGELPPVIYIQEGTAVPAHPLFASNKVSIVLPSTRDGFNLIAQEVLVSAAQNNSGSNVLLSINTGAHEHLNDNVISIDPKNPEQIGGAMKKALEVSEDVKKARAKAGAAFVKDNDAGKWFQGLVATLDQVKPPHQTGQLESALSSQPYDINIGIPPASTLFVLDFDGTISDTVDDPSGAEPVEGARDKIRQATEAGYQVAVVTGRNVSFIKAQLGDDCGDVKIVGNHGLSMEAAQVLITDAHRNELTNSKVNIKSALDGIEGIHVEEKDIGFAVHYRQVADDKKHEVIAKVIEILNSYRNLRIQPGRDVLEILPDIPWNKGMAAEALAKSGGAKRVLAVGDGQTDESMFSLVAHSPDYEGVGIVVAGDESRPTAASLSLRGPSQVVEFLEVSTSKGGK